MEFKLSSAGKAPDIRYSPALPEVPGLCGFRFVGDSRAGVVGADDAFGSRGSSFNDLSDMVDRSDEIVDAAGVLVAILTGHAHC